MQHALATAITISVLWLSLAGGLAAQQPPDLVLRGGKVVTLDEENRVVQALAASGDKIIAIGSDEQVSQLIGPRTKVVELHGNLAVPGFIEGHGHFVSLGQSKMMLDLTSAKSWDDIVRQVGAAVRSSAPGQWIMGRGWHQAKWKVRPQPNVDGYPTHEALSRASPEHPVILVHASGHMCLANDMAMRMAGIDRSRGNPPGGEILKDAQGNPIGAFRETAQQLVHRARAADLDRRSKAERTEELLAAIRLATKECLAHGVTSFQDAGSPFSTIDVFRDLAERGELKVRLWVMVRASNEMLSRRLATYRMIGFGKNFLTVRAIKRSIDGALGSHGAWLLAPYEDLPASLGLNTSSVSSIRETARLALQHNYQLCVHAIGDRANHETLNLFDDALVSNPTTPSRRWRIEHAQHLHKDDIPRFARLGVIASMQGIHCTSDAVFVIQRLGMRRASEGAYVWRSLLDAGAVVTNGTDAPVECIDPIACYWASVTRKLPTGVAFFPAQRMTRMEALRSYTRDTAFAAFEEHMKGTLSVGKLADIVVLSRDITTVREEEIPDAHVLYTIIGGRVVYRREGLAKERSSADPEVQIRERDYVER